MYRIATNNELADYISAKRDLSLTKIVGLSISEVLPSDISDVTFVSCVFPEGVTMPEAMTGALFLDCCMAGVKFSGANLFDTQFVRCDLSAAEFSNCDLSAAQFIDCRMETARIIDCDLEAAFLTAGQAHPPLQAA